MNSEKVISNIEKAIKEHLDNNYAYDMLVDFELDVIDWNSLFEYIDKLQQENKQLKIQISAREEVYNRLESNWNKLNKKYENAVADYEKTMFEKEQLKKQLEEKNKPQIFIDTQNIEERYAEGLYQDYLEEENKKHKNQQKEFIKYMNKTIEELECDDVDDEEMKGYLIQRINTFKEILRKYKSIIGVSDEKKRV